MALVQRAREIETEEEIQRIYNWMDDLDLSRPRRNISRDFADGVLLAEVLHQYFPKLVELHNYSQANSQAQKLYNWNTLNRKVLKKIGCQLHPEDVDDVIRAIPGAVEKILVLVQHHMARYKRELEQGRASETRGTLSRAANQQNAGVGGAGIGGQRPKKSTQQRPQSQMTNNNSMGTNDGYDGMGNNSMDDRGGMQKNFMNQISQNQMSQMSQKSEDQELTVAELRETVLIMSEKIKKLEQLVRIKDAKLIALQSKVESLLQKRNM